MIKKVLRIISSLIMPFACMGFFGTFYIVTSSDGQMLYRKLIIIALLLALISSILIVVWGLIEIEHIINYMVILITSGIVIAITWIWMLNEFEAKIVFYSVYALPLYIIYYILRKKKIKEIVVYILINPIIYYLVFFFLFLLSLSKL